MNEGCVLVGRAHPRHPFTMPHPTVHELLEQPDKNTSNARETKACKIGRVDCSSYVYKSICVGF